MLSIKSKLDKITNNVSLFSNEIQIDTVNSTILYHKELSDLKEFYEYFYNRINKKNINSLEKIFPGIINRVIDINNNLVNQIQSGNILLYINDSDILYEISLKTNIDRNITTSIIDPLNLYGAQDGFIENIDKNYSLIKKRIKSNNLMNVKFIMGTRTNTIIYLSYIEDLVPKNQLKKIQHILKSQNIDSILSYNDIAHLFNKNNLFPVIGTTSSPEIASEQLLQGRMLILIDNSPVVIILPYTLKAHTLLKDENSSPIYHALYNRIITLLMIFFGIFFLGLYVAVINYHSKNLSIIVISEVKMTARGTTMPLFMEIIILLLLFEFLKLASVKTPSTNIQNVIVIVGGLLIGQNIVSSGFIGAFNFVITAVCFLCTFGITNNQHLIISISILRFIVLISGALLGIFGILISFFIILTYMIKIQYLDSYYLSPIIPTKFKELLRVIIPRNYFKKKIRPKNSVYTDDTAGGLNV